MNYNVTAIVPTKGRKDVFKTHAEPFLISLGIPYLVGIEESERDYYGHVDNAIYYKDNIGLCGALLELKKHVKTGLIFKVDDDVKGFTTDMAKMLPRYQNLFKKDDRLGAIAFPYKQEFYYSDDKFVSHMNARLQTSYLIKKEVFSPDVNVDVFEDFAQFISLVNQGYYTLLSPKAKIICKPVGSGNGGIENSTRHEKALKCIEYLTEKYPNFNLGVKNKPKKYWAVEIDLSKEPRLKKISL